MRVSVIHRPCVHTSGYGLKPSHLSPVSTFSWPPMGILAPRGTPTTDEKRKRPSALAQRNLQTKPMRLKRPPTYPATTH
jgi:hypothetical protein